MAQQKAGLFDIDEYRDGIITRNDVALHIIATDKHKNLMRNRSRAVYHKKPNTIPEKQKEYKAHSGRFTKKFLTRMARHSSSATESFHERLNRNIKNQNVK